MKNVLNKKIKINRKLVHQATFLPKNFYPKTFFTEKHFFTEGPIRKNISDKQKNLFTKNFCSVQTVSPKLFCRHRTLFTKKLLFTKNFFFLTKTKVSHNNFFHRKIKKKSLDKNQTKMLTQLINLNSDKTQKIKL